MKRTKISIHAAREGGDALAVYIVKKDKISIHAAREGGDLYGRTSRITRRYFNPRRP